MSWPLISCFLIGCHADRPDLASETARLTGIENAIEFRETADPIDSPSSAGGKLTLSQAVRLALLHDPRIQASLARVRIAEAEANQARLLPNPILTLDFRVPPSGHPNNAFEPSLSTDLISILQKPAQIRAADQRLNESAMTALVTVLDVISETQEAYVSARTVDAEIENAQRRRQRLQQLRDLAQKRLEAGEATRLDVITVESQLMQSALELAEFEQQRIQERLILARLLGNPRSDANWELAEGDLATSATLAPESDWVDAALAARPEISARIWELKALGEDSKIASLSALQGGELGVHGERDPEWRLGPTLTTPLPIFDFGQASRARMTAQRIAARHELAQQQLEVIQDVRLAYAQYIHSRQMLSNARQMLLPLQRQQFEQSKLAYEAGEVDLTTLLLAQNDLELTLSRVIELQENVTLALIKLHRAAGGAGVAGRINAATQPPPARTMPATTRTADPPTDVPASLPATGSAR